MASYLLSQVHREKKRKKIENDPGFDQQKEFPSSSCFLLWTRKPLGAELLPYKILRQGDKRTEECRDNEEL
jgi:hypothetical protein